MGTLVADTRATFPYIASYGFKVNPRYLVKIIQREGGYERRDRRWNRALVNFSTYPMEAVTPQDADAALTFYHAMGGTATGFRLRDFADYQSCGSKPLTPAAGDQPLIFISGSTWQLTKQYVAGSIVQYRDIIKPIGSTISIANTLGAVQTDWSLNCATGVVTIGGTFSGTPGTWGGQFDCYVRFDGDLNLAINDFSVTDFSMNMQELRCEDT